MHHSNSPLVVHKQVGRIKLAPVVQPSSESANIRVVATNFNKLVEKVRPSDQIVSISSYARIGLEICTLLILLL